MLPNQYPMLHRHWRINILRKQRANNNILIVFHSTEKYIFLLGDWMTIAMKLIYLLLWQKIKYFENSHATDEFTPDFEGKDDDNYSLLQNPTKTPIISKDFFRVLPHCPIIHCASQMDQNPKLCFCPCSTHSSPWRENKKGLYS
jgi:hypothetical protein